MLISEARAIARQWQGLGLRSREERQQRDLNQAGIVGIGPVARFERAFARRDHPALGNVEANRAPVQHQDLIARLGPPAMVPR